jgi:hypothetical protein
MSITNNIYNILSKLNSLTESAKPAETAAETVYESVEPRGSITEAVKSLEAKFATFKEAKKAKPDFLDVDKDGDKAEPFKKAVKDKKAVEEGSIAKPQKDLKKHSATAKRMATQKKADKDHESWLAQLEKTDPDHPSLKYRKQATNEGQGPYTLDDPKHPKFKANYEKYKKAHPDCTLAEFVAAMKKKEKGLNEADDLTDLDAYQFADPDKDTAVKPATAKQAAAERRRRLQDLEDKKAEKDDWFGGKDKESNVRVHRAKYQAEPEELDEYSQAEYDQAMGDFNAKGGKAQQLPPGSAKNPISTASRHIAGRGEAGKGKTAGRGANVSASKPVVDVYETDKLDELSPQTMANYASKAKGQASWAKGVAQHGSIKGTSAAAPYEKLAAKRQTGAAKADQRVGDKADAQSYDWANKGGYGDKSNPAVKEVAPPGKKAERMVKHIKKGYADDGKLTKREKGIAYATAWKAHNKGQVEEGVEFKDAGKIKNSAPNMKKAKPAMVKESRVMEETDYFYEKVAKSLCGKNPNLDTAGSEFEMAVRKEMIAQGIEPNRARNILLMDEDFLGDVATAYGHYCKEQEKMEDMHQSNIPSPTNIKPVTKELDEIAALAGLARAAVPAVASSLTDSKYMEETLGVTVNGKEINVSSIEVEGVNSWDSPDFVDAYITYAEFADGTPLSDDELDQLTDEHGDLVNQAAHDSLQGAGDFLDEDDVAEGNEFSGALAAAKASGAKEFEVDGKRYTVKEDINVSITANGQEDAINLFRKLAGMDEVETPATLKMPKDLETALAQGAIEPVEEERDIEYVNTPNEKIAPISASIPNGTDLHRSKMQDPATANRAANPLRKEQQVEENLWKSYKSILADVKAK